MKDFAELMRETYKIAGKRIPNMAYMDLPRVISPETREKMMNRSPEELAEIIIAMIDEINHGSIESVDLILNRLLS